MTRFRLLWFLVALPAAAAQGESYACPGSKGMTVYQNFACSLDSLGSVPANSKVGKVPSPPGKAAQEYATAVALSSGTPSKGSGVGEPRPGISADDVRKAWGEPEEIVQDEPPSGRVEIWRYKNGRSVQINRRHRVVAVEL